MSSAHMTLDSMAVHVACTRGEETVVVKSSKHRLQW